MGARHWLVWILLSNFDSISMTSVTTSEVSVTRKRQTNGTFDGCINQKITLPKLNDDSSTNDQWIWLADVRRYIDSGSSMDILESEINKSLLTGFWGVLFHQSQMLGDTVEEALNKMRHADQHQHSDGLLQEFYAMTQRHNEPTGKYAIKLDLAACKVRLQSMEALGSTEEERGRLLIDCLLRSMDPKLWDQVAHVVNGKVAHDRPTYWQLVKFAVGKEAEINFDEAKKAPKPKTTTHFCFDCRKPSLPATPAVWMVAPALEEDTGEEKDTPQPSEDSDSGESYEVQQDDLPVSPGDVKVAIRVAHASEAFSG